jgi:hypothetical protein
LDPLNEQQGPCNWSKSPANTVALPHRPACTCMDHRIPHSPSYQRTCILARMKAVLRFLLHGYEIMSSQKCPARFGLRRRAVYVTCSQNGSNFLAMMCSNVLCVFCPVAPVAPRSPLKAAHMVFLQADSKDKQAVQGCSGQ